MWIAGAFHAGRIQRPLYAVIVGSKKIGSNPESRYYKCHVPRARPPGDGCLTGCESEFGDWILPPGEKLHE